MASSIGALRSYNNRLGLLGYVTGKDEKGIPRRVDVIKTEEGKTRNAQACACMERPGNVFGGQGGR